MEISKYFWIAFFLFIPLYTAAQNEPCVHTTKHDPIRIDIQQQSTPLLVNDVIVITAALTQNDLYDILNQYQYPPNINEVEPCFYLHQEGGFAIISGKEEGDCDLFDSGGQAQKTWVFEAVRPGANQRITFSLGWKYIDAQEVRPICFSQPQERFITVACTTHWLWNSAINNWDKIAIVAVAIASLVVSIIALIKKATL